MGAAELYITLLSVCERLLKALKSRGSDTGALPATKLPQTKANDGVSPSRGEKEGGRTGVDVHSQGWGGDDTQIDCLFQKNNAG